MHFYRFSEIPLMYGNSRKHAGALTSGSSVPPLPPDVVRSLQMPLAITMQSDDSAPVQNYTQMPTYLNRHIESVFLCFYAPKGAKPATAFGKLVDYWTGLMGERYQHVECLFDRGTNEHGVYDEHRFHALNVSAKDASGCYQRAIDYYRDGRWAVYRLKDLTDNQKKAMYDFARKESKKQRKYNYGSTVSTNPGCHYLLPVCTYTPGFSRCIPTGEDTVFCVQLMMEVMKQAYPTKLADLRADSMRPDVFLAQMCARIPGITQVSLIVDTQSERQLVDKLSRIAGTNVWDPPN